MDYEEFNIFCQNLKATTYAQQWGNSHVWKVGGKVFTIGGWAESMPAFTFKTNEFMYDILKDEPGLRPAPYMASRGMKWIQHYDSPGLSHEKLKSFIEESYSLVIEGLTKTKRKELGI